MDPSSQLKCGAQWKSLGGYGRQVSFFNLNSTWLFFFVWSIDLVLISTTWAPWKTRNASKIDVLAKIWWMNRVVQAKRGQGQGPGKEPEAGGTWQCSAQAAAAPGRVKILGVDDCLWDSPQPGLLGQAEGSGSLKAAKESAASIQRPWHNSV